MSFALTQFNGFAVGQGIVLNYLAFSESSTDLTNYTFSAVSLGTASSDRRIVVGVASRSATASRTVSSMTIGGVSASRIANASFNPDTGSNICEMWTALVPTGTTGDIVVNTPGANLRMAIGVWSITGANDAVYDAVTQTASSGTTVSQTVSVPGMGVVLAFKQSNSSSGTPTTTWTGPTESFDETAGEATTLNYSGASRVYSESASALTVTATMTVAIASNVGGALCVVSYAPI